MEKLRRIDIEHRVLKTSALISQVYNESVLEKVEELKKIRRVVKNFEAIGHSSDHNEHYGNLSARVLRNKFLCTATQTSGKSEEEMSLEDYPIIYDVDSIVLSLGLNQDKKPDEECSTHDGFYRGNEDISYVLHMDIALYYITMKKHMVQFY